MDRSPYPTSSQLPIAHFNGDNYIPVGDAHGSTDEHSATQSRPRPMSPLRNQDLNPKLNNAASSYKEHLAQLELDEAIHRAEAARAKLQQAREKRQASEGSENPDYLYVLRENECLRQEMEELRREVRILSKHPVEEVPSPANLAQIAKEVGRTMRGSTCAPFVASFPFTEKVMQESTPLKFKVLTIPQYDGTSDPTSFVATYRQHMVIHD